MSLLAVCKLLLDVLLLDALLLAALINKTWILQQKHNSVIHWRSLKIFAFPNSYEYEKHPTMVEIRKWKYSQMRMEECESIAHCHKLRNELEKTSEKLVHYLFKNGNGHFDGLLIPSSLAKWDASTEDWFVLMHWFLWRSPSLESWLREWIIT